MKHTFVLSDETMNSYNFVVKTDGIDLSRFQKNPIMLYMHERDNGIIGRWENVRKEDNKLLADAFFDSSDELGWQIRQKVDKGFLHSVSIGIEDVEFKEINGVNTVIKCVLKEASIVDIPSNKNAVKLYKNNGTITYNLYDLEKDTDREYNTPEEFVSELLSILELREGATASDIIAKAKTLKNSSSQNELNKALKLGYIDQNEHSFLLKMNDSKPIEVTNFLKDKMSGNESAISDEVGKANREGKIIFYDKKLYENIGLEIGLKNLRKLFRTMPTQTKVLDFIEGGKDSNRKDWGLNEYRKYAPQELRDNPELYQQLIAQEKDKTTIELGLDYYRKNDPQYLKDNPKEYQRLVRENKRK